MARYGFSMDIFSPIHSDTSINDNSVFSYGSLPDTPDYEKDIESPMSKIIETDSDTDVCAKAMKESAKTFEMITNDIKKQSNINAEKEERLKESCEVLKQSMDNLFYKKSSKSSIVQSELKNTELENFSQAVKVDSKISTLKTSENHREKNVCKKTHSDSKIKSQVPNQKPEKNKREVSSTINKEKKMHHQHKNSCTMKESAENSKVNVHKRKETVIKKDALIDSNKTKNSKITSTQTTKSSEASATSSKNSSEKNEGKVITGSVKNFDFKSQKKIPVSSNMPTIEEKSLSIEKSIQIAIGMEMDNIRRFMLDQNLNIRKDLLKLQEMTKKQAEITGYLFSVIDELVETNKKLISKYN